MYRDRDNRGRFSRAAHQSDNYQHPVRSSNTASSGESSPTWNSPRNSRGRGRRIHTLPNNNTHLKRPGFRNNVQDNRDNKDYRGWSLNDGSLLQDTPKIRDLPPPPSSPPPQTSQSGMSPPLGSTKNNPDNLEIGDHDTSPQNHSPPNISFEEDNTKNKQESGTTNDSPLTAATLEAVMAKSMSKVFGKLDVLSKDLKKVQDNQANVNKMAVEVKQVQQEVKRIDESVKEIYKLSAENSSRNDEIVEEVRTLQAQTRAQSQTGMNPETELEFLKVKASTLKNNLIIEGIPELSEISEEESKTILTTDDQIIDFFDKILGFSQVDIDSIYRLGKPRQDPTSPRPIMVKFLRPRDREAIWNAKSLLNNKANSRYHIKEDLPPKLRPHMTALLKVQQQAKRFPKSYHNVFIRDYNIHLNGKTYTPLQLENLPRKLRPSVSSTPGNIDAVVFYGRHSKFSNHHLCTFMVGDICFNSIEQYLAYKRANIANDPVLAQEALNAVDPVDCKRILTSLKNASSENTWLEKRHDVLFSGLYAKFTQNQSLLSYLMDSENRQLGEASRDPTWGIGMTLTDKRVLEVTQWKGGNLLGKTLMEVRQDIFSSIYQSPTQETPPKSSSQARADKVTTPDNRNVSDNNNTRETNGDTRSEAPKKDNNKENKGNRDTNSDSSKSSTPKTDHNKDNSEIRNTLPENSTPNSPALRDSEKNSTPNSPNPRDSEDERAAQE